MVDIEAHPPSRKGEREEIDPTVPRRFKMPKGGRPKGAKNRKTIIRKVALESHTVREDGRTRKLTALEIVLNQLSRAAMTGNQRAFGEMDRLLSKYGADESGGGSGVLVVSHPMTPEEAIADGERANEEARRRWAEELNDEQ